VGESNETARLDEEERQRILQQISLGELSATEAIELLQGD
jgi:hypothetical protein